MYIFQKHIIPDVCICSDKNNRVLLKVMSDSGDIRGTFLNPFIIQDNTGTVLLQFGVVILVGLALSKFFNTKTARGAMKDNKAAK